MRKDWKVVEEVVMAHFGQTDFGQFQCFVVVLCCCVVVLCVEVWCGGVVWCGVVGEILDTCVPCLPKALLHGSVDGDRPAPWL